MTSLTKMLAVAGIASVAWTDAHGNPIVIDNCRFTFITPNLVRMEYANKGKFLDDKTLFAQNRDILFDGVQVEKKDNNRYVFTTPAMRLEYQNDGFPFGQSNIKASFKMDGKDCGWGMASSQRRNLKGAIATLDGIGGPVPLEEGLLSRDGWYLIQDSNKEVLKNDWVTLRDRDHVQDLYLFVYGNDYKAALQSLKAVSGAAPMPRKYVHGSWYCRWWSYTADDYCQLVKEYKEHDFPLDIMVFDMDWHRKDGRVGTAHAGTRGWTGYSWNRQLIPDPAGLIAEFKKDNISVVLNEHPHDGIRDHEDMYPAFMKEMGQEPVQGKNIVFDAGDKKYMDAFMKHAHEESDKMGVAFWWLDWQQDYVYPVVRGTNMKHLPWLNHLYFNYSKQDNLRGAGFSRWGGWGDHRHPIQFSGDSGGNWNMLKFEIELTATSGNAGCFFWAHDLGGFYGGEDAELMARWIQFGLLNSSLRLHSVGNPDRRPWKWGEQAENSMRSVYHLRSRLMPYIYSSVRQCHTDMLPLNRAMYIEYPGEEDAYKNPQEFLFGDLLLGAPITTAGKGDAKVAEQRVWLPPHDVWYQFYSGKKYDGGQYVTESCDINSFPLFVKGGYPMPMQPYTDRMTSADLKTLVVRCYPGSEGASNSFSLYEDDGMTRDYEQGKCASTRLDYSLKDGVTEITVNPAEGSYQGQVKARSYRFELPSTSADIRATVNGKDVQVTPDESLQGFTVEVPETDIREKVTLRFSAK